MTPEEAGQRYEATGRVTLRTASGYVVVLRDDLPLSPVRISGEPAALFRESELPYLRSLGKEALAAEIQARKASGAPPESAPGSEFLPLPPPPPRKRSAAPGTAAAPLVPPAAEAPDEKPEEAPYQRTREGETLLANVLDIMDGRLLGEGETC